MATWMVFKEMDGGEIALNMDLVEKVSPVMLDDGTPGVSVDGRLLRADFVRVGLALSVLVASVS